MTSCKTRLRLTGSYTVSGVGDGCFGACCPFCGPSGPDCVATDASPHGIEQYLKDNAFECSVHTPDLPGEANALPRVCHRSLTCFFGPKATIPKGFQGQVGGLALQSHRQPGDQPRTFESKAERARFLKEYSCAKAFLAQSCELQMAATHGEAQVAKVHQCRCCGGELDESNIQAHLKLALELWPSPNQRFLLETLQGFSSAHACESEDEKGSILRCLMLQALVRDYPIHRMCPAHDMRANVQQVLDYFPGLGPDHTENKRCT